MMPREESDRLEQVEMIDDPTDLRLPATDAGADKPAAPKAKHHKLTGPELEARFTAWATLRRDRSTERAAARTPEIRKQTARRGIAVTLGLVLAATAVLSAASSAAYEDATAANASRIDSLQNQAPSPETTSTSTAEPVDAKALAALSVRAAKIAREVAEKQQRYAALFHALNDAPSAGNGSPNEATLKTVRHRKTLAPYWDVESLVVEDSLAYTFTTTPYFDRDEMDPRFPWYVRYDALKASDPRLYSWRVESVMPTIDAPSTARVVWVSRDVHGTVLAWASATYTDSTRRLSRLELVVTAAGQQHQYETDTAKTDKMPELSEGTEQMP